MLRSCLRFVWRCIPRPLRVNTYWLYEKALEKFHEIFDWVIDRYYNVKTGTRTRYPEIGVDTSELNQDDPYSNVPSAYFSLFRIVRRLRPSTSDIIYDLGCGLGRSLFVFSRYGIERVVGIEFNDMIFQNLSINVDRFRNTSNRVRIEHRDVLKCDIDPATIIYMYNPFGDDTMVGLVDHISNSLARNPRKLRIIYWNPLHLDKLQELSGFTIDRQFVTNKKIVVFATVDMQLQARNP